MSVEPSQHAPENKEEEGISIQNETEVPIAAQEGYDHEDDDPKTSIGEEPQNSAGNEDESDEDEPDIPDNISDYKPIDAPPPLPMPSFTDFEVPLPEIEESPEEPEEEPKPLASLPDVVHIPSLLKPIETSDPSPSLQGIEIVEIARECGLTGNLQASYLRLPPGTRTTRV